MKLIITSERYFKLHRSATQLLKLHICRNIWPRTMYVFYRTHTYIYIHCTWSVYAQDSGDFIIVHLNLYFLVFVCLSIIFKIVFWYNIREDEKFDYYRKYSRKNWSNPVWLLFCIAFCRQKRIRTIDGNSHKLVFRYNNESALCNGRLIFIDHSRDVELNSTKTELWPYTEFEWVFKCIPIFIS